MTGEESEAGRSEFEQHARALLLQSADELPGAVRSRLTQARHAALAARRSRLPSFARRWGPAGAVVASVLALLLVYGPHGRGALENPVASGGVEDIELLSDNDAVPLNGDQDVDDDFYEWAATEAAGATAPAIGS